MKLPCGGGFEFVCVSDRRVWYCWVCSLAPEEFPYELLSFGADKQY